MATDTEDAWAVIDTLQVILSAGQRYEWELRARKQTDEGDKVWRANTELAQQIDFLIGTALSLWAANTKAQLKKLQAASDDVKKAIEGIDKTIKKIGTVVKVVGYLDEAIEIAKKVAKYM